MKVKICGITNLEDAMLCESQGADAIGFIFYDKSKRFISPEKAKEIIKHLSPFTLKVGVFVNETSANIEETARKIKLNAVQLHGDETQKEIDAINLPVIKAVRIKSEDDYSKLAELNNCSILLDAFSEKEYGGTGKTIDWNLIPEDKRSKIILAGGISADNIEFVFNNIKPAAVDLSSSLELTPGKKDETKIRLFFNKLNKLRSQKWLS